MARSTSATGNGRSEAFLAYGRRPWERGFKDDVRDAVEAKTLHKFQAEWAAMMELAYRGVCEHFGGKRRTADSDEIHQIYLARDRKESEKRGERARRRRLKRAS